MQQIENTPVSVIRNTYALRTSTEREVDLSFQPLTDPGNAQRLVELHGHKMHWVSDWMCWVVWDSQRWQKDNKGQVQRWCWDTLRSASDWFDDYESREVLLKSENRTKQILGAAKSIEGVTKESKEFNTNIHLLNLNNGTLDVRTGDLREHSPQDFITKICRIDYNPEAKCPHWDKFMLDSHLGDEDLVGYLQEAVGLSFSGSSEKVVFCLFGPTNTGKTTFLRGIANVLGPDYAGQVDIESLMGNSKQSNNNALSDLGSEEGKYFVTTSEAESMHRISESLIKSLTQGEGNTVKVKMKYRNAYLSLVTYKLWMDANHRPKIYGSDDSIWNRFHPIPWMNRVEDSWIDRTLLTKFKDEVQGILAWGIKGRLRLHERGDHFEIPEAIKRERQQWRDENNPLKELFEQELIIDIGNDELWISNETLNEVVNSYWESHTGGKAFRPSDKQVRIRLAELGCKRLRRSVKSKQIWGWKGCALREQPDITT